MPKMNIRNGRKFLDGYFDCEFDIRTEIKFI